MIVEAGISIVVAYVASLYNVVDCIHLHVHVKGHLSIGNVNSSKILNLSTVCMVIGKYQFIKILCMHIMAQNGK